MVNEITARPLGRLGRAVKVHSRILDTDLWLVPDEAADATYDAPVYTASECAELLARRPSPGQLRAVHLVKTMLQGEVTGTAEAAGVRRRRDDLLAAYRAAAERLDAGAEASAGTELMRIARQLSHVLYQIDQVASPGNGDSAAR